MTCSVSGDEGGGGVSLLPLLVAYIWKRMEMAALSGFMNKERSQKGCGCDRDGQPTLQILLPLLWKENEHLRVSIK